MRTLLPFRPMVRLAAACLLCAAAPASLAAGPTFELTPFAGARFGGGFDVDNETGGSTNVDLGSGASFGVSMGLYRDSFGIYELLYSQQSTDIDSRDPQLRNVDLDIRYIHVGGTAFFPEEGSEHWVPYLSLTLGATQLDPSGGYDSETKFSASIGGGMRFPVNDRFAISLGLRGYMTVLDSDTRLFCVSGTEESGCLVKSSGTTFWQGEGQLGFSFIF